LVNLLYNLLTYQDWLSINCRRSGFWNSNCCSW